jgi:uncharacterized protein DUF5666
MPATEPFSHPNRDRSASMDTADDDLFDPEWDRPTRTNRLTVTLVAGLLVVAGFAGGALTQRAVAEGSPTVSGRGSGAVTVGGGPRYVGAGGAPGASRAPGAPPAAETTPTTTGTIRSIEDTTLTLAGAAGATVTVTVPATASVTTRGMEGLAVGVPVAVRGSRNPDGSITATDVTAR